MAIAALKFNKHLLPLALVLPAILLMQCSTGNVQTADSGAGLIQQDGWELVQETCTECHSTQIIVQNSGSREVWKSRITWMQETQGLGQLDLATENSILDYLASNYGQKSASRRAGLTAHLLPDNRYSSTE